MADEMVQTTADPTAQEPTGPVQPFDLDDEKFLTHLLQWFKEATEAKKPKLEKRKRDFEFYAGKQWRDEDKRIADILKRPALTFNMVLGIISAVEGEERENRQDIKFYGNGVPNNDGAFGLNRLLKWVMYQCGGEFALSRQFRDGFIAGSAWVVPEVDYLEDPEGKICLMFVEDEEIAEDPLSTCPVFSDGRYLTRSRRMTMEEMEARWPGSSERLQANCQNDADVVETDGKGYRDIYSEPGVSTSPKLYDMKSKQWTVVETWWYQIEPGWIVSNPDTGMLEEKTPDEFEAMRNERAEQFKSFLAATVSATQAPPMTAMVPGMAPPAAPVMPEMPKPLDAVQRPVKRMYSAFTCFKTVLERKPAPIAALKRVPYVPFNCYYDKIEKEFFGAVRSITDPQLQHNVEQSIIVQLMQLMPKGSWMGPKGSFHNKVDWEKGLAQPGKLLEYNLTRGKPEAIQTPPIPRHLVDMAFTRPQSMRDISGVNVELTGQRGGNDAGVVMEKRRSAAKTVLAPVFDNNRQMKIELGKILLSYIQTYISVGRKVAVLGPEGTPQMIEMTGDMKLARYGITTDEGENAVNDEQDALMVMQTTLPTMMKAGIPVTPEFIDLLPLPPHIRDSWKRQIAWNMTVTNQLPPEGWQPGMPVPMPGAPAMPGAVPPEQPPQQPPQP